MLYPQFLWNCHPTYQINQEFAKFVWSEECQVAFELLKTSLTTVHFLGYLDVNNPFILYTVASDNCIRACLCQPCDDGEGTQPGMTNEQSLYFLFHKLGPLKLDSPQLNKNVMLYKN